MFRSTAARRAAAVSPIGVLAAAGVLAASLALAGCGFGGDASLDGSSGPFKAADCPEQPATTWAEPATGGGTHPVRTAMGEVRVPNSPKRVVVLDTAELDSAITLGVKPVGATRSEAASGSLDYLAGDQVAGIKDVGEIGAPDLEAIAALKPDLILTSKVRDGRRYDRLTRIAPTVMTETTGYPWKQNFATHADALGQIPRARRAAAAYEAHAERVAKALGGPAAHKLRTNIVRFVEGADARVYGCRSYIGTVLADIGTGPTDVVDGSKDGLMVELGPERIGEADADAVFYASYGTPKKSKEAQITTGGRWKRMRAVTGGRSFRVDDRLWIQGIGYTGAGRILDEVRQRLVKK
ncbi:ABC transporter substrate-binding protein [Streptomyces sp. NPDC050355]|uniref:ABC transporter substrate-binding protein n=1 Tax=Streptomyces sp. NPDC050355 TaxID=3365609 RepID=UPI0037BD4A79